MDVNEGRPNSSTKVKRLDYRLLYPLRPQPRVAYVLALLILSIAGYFLLFLSEVFTHSPIPWRPDSYDLLFVYVLMVSWLIMFIAMIVQLWPRKPFNWRDQYFSHWKRVGRGVLGVTWMSIILLIAFVAIYQYGVEEGWQNVWRELGELDVLSKVPLLMLAVFFVILIAMNIWVLLGTAKAWQMARRHGIMQANFQKSSYRPGDVVQFTTTDKMSSDHQLRYRVHLNFIDAKKRTVGRGKRKRSYMGRSYLHAQHQDVTPRQLQQGLSFTLPEAKEGQSWATAPWHHTHFCFWEILIEEQEGTFYAPFWIKVEGALKPA